ncbi:hypothetical protein TNCV_819091 [Trichonephila clavipes]|nr:hypothetical protein TNCV_819091 [Trichonephila clavipes]
MSLGLEPLKTPVKKRAMRVMYIEAQTSSRVAMWQKVESGVSTGVISVTLSRYWRAFEAWSSEEDHICAGTPLSGLQ